MAWTISRHFHKSNALGPPACLLRIQKSMVFTLKNYWFFRTSQVSFNAFQVRCRMSKSTTVQSEGENNMDAQSKTQEVLSLGNQ